MIMPCVCWRRYRFSRLAGAACSRRFGFIGKVRAAVCLVKLLPNLVFLLIWQPQVVAVPGGLDFCQGFPGLYKFAHKLLVFRRVFWQFFGCSGLCLGVWLGTFTIQGLNFLADHVNCRRIFWIVWIGRRRAISGHNWWSSRIRWVHGLLS